MASNWRFPINVSGDLPSVSGHSLMSCDVLTTEDCSGSDDDEGDASKEEILDMPAYWIEALNKPNDFTEWIKLVAVAEGKKNVAACRKVYDAFLFQFPLAHVSWKKYADIMQQIGSAEETEKVFSRAVKVNPLNVTLWVNYISYVKKNLDMSLPTSHETLDRVITDAVEAAGMEFLSDGLWNLCIEWVIKRGQLKRVLTLLDRVLCIPTQQYQFHFNRFKAFVAHYSPIEILSSDELEWIHSKIQLENENNLVADEDCPLEDVIQSLTDSEIEKFREHIIKSREQIYFLNEVEVKKRISFEQEITSLYFTALPLNMKQLQNWRRYLDFEISQGQHERIVILYERCLMSCTMYEDFWLAYARYMESHSVEAARSIYKRACMIHLPRKITLHFHWAEFEEKHGCVDSARFILCNAENVKPGLAMVCLRRVNLERRNGNLQEAEKLLREAVQFSSGKELAAFYTVKLARLLLKLKNDPEKARAVITEALQKEPGNIRLHHCLLEIEISRDAAADAVLCVETALKNNLNIDAKRRLLHRLLQFLDDEGTSVTSWVSAFHKHETLLTEHEVEEKQADTWKKNAENKITKTGSSASSTQSSVVKSSVQPQVSVTKCVTPSVAPKPLRSIVPVHYPRQQLTSPSPFYASPPQPLNYARSPVPYRQPYYIGGHPRLFFYSQTLRHQNIGQFTPPRPWSQNRFYPPY